MNEEQVVARARAAKRILFVTGAGMSAGSGLPTYRGIGGLYDQDTTEDGVAIEEALSGRMLRSNPTLCWKYIAQIESACRGATPNPGHQAITALQDGREVWVLTQNVDGLHQAAGTNNVIEIHGNVHKLVCTQCGEGFEVADYSHLNIPPSCDSCGGLVRPRVVLFGEMLPSQPLQTLAKQFQRGFDMVFSVGTTSVFPYIAEPVIRAADLGAISVEINPSITTVSELVDCKVTEPAESWLPKLL